MKIHLNENSGKWKAFAIAGCICVFAYVVLSNLGVIFTKIGGFLNYFQSIFFGIIISYIVNPLANLIDKGATKLIKKDKARWSFSVLVTMILVLVLFIVFLMAVIPTLFENVDSLLSNMDKYLADLEEKASAISPNFKGLVSSAYTYLTKKTGSINKISDLLSSNLGNLVESLSSVGTIVVNWLIAYVISIYILLAKEDICEFFRKLTTLVLSPMNYCQVTHFIKKFNLIFTKYIICELLDAVIVGGANFVFMICMRMPDALFISIIVGITNLAPTFGPIIGGAFGAFILVLIKPEAVLPFLLFTVFIQTIDGYVIKPKFFGGALNVPGVLILSAIIVFGKMMGIVGMLIAIPIAAILSYLYTEIFIPWLELKKDLEQYKKEQDRATAMLKEEE